MAAIFLIQHLCNFYQLQIIIQLASLYIEIYFRHFMYDSNMSGCKVMVKNGKLAAILDAIFKFHKLVIMLSTKIVR